MKTIGLIGGTGWVSSVEYYRLINEGVNAKLGGQEFARSILYSLNYGDIVRLAEARDDEAIYKLLKDAAVKLVNSGARCLALCANTAHLYYDRLQSEIDIPMIHIAAATAAAIQKQNMSTVGLLGTKTTMEGTFYQDVLAKAGIMTIVPSEEERDFIHEVIFRELFFLDFKEESRQRFVAIMENLVKQGAEGIVLGCTEIPLLIEQKHFRLPVFNTLDIHAAAIVEYAVND